MPPSPQNRDCSLLLDSDVHDRGVESDDMQLHILHPRWKQYPQQLRAIATLAHDYQESRLERT